MSKDTPPANHELSNWHKTKTRREFVRPWTFIPFLGATACKVQKQLEEWEWEIRLKRDFRDISPNQIDKNASQEIVEWQEWIFRDSITIPGDPEKKNWQPTTAYEGDLGWTECLITSDDGTIKNPKPTLDFARVLSENHIQGHFFICGYGQKISQKEHKDMSREEKLKEIFFCPDFTPTDYGPNDLKNVKWTDHYKKIVQFVKDIHNLWHYVHNHTWNHTHLDKVMTPDEQKAYLFGVEVLSVAINEALGKEQKTRLFRYPYGKAPKGETEFTENISKHFGKLGIRAFGWTADSIDWKKPSPQTIKDTIRKAVDEKWIYLMHDKNWRIHAELMWLTIPEDLEEKKVSK